MRPLFFFFIAFIIILIGLFSKFAFPTVSNQNIKNYISTSTTTNKTIPSLDFSRPVECQYRSKEASISAFMQGTRMQIDITKKQTVQQLFIQDDCLYTRTKQEKKGVKICGVGRIISLTKQFVTTEMFDSVIQEKIQSSLGISASKQELMQSCKNVNSIPEAIFVLPKDIVFEGK